MRGERERWEERERDEGREREMGGEREREVMMNVNGKCGGESDMRHPAV